MIHIIIFSKDRPLQLHGCLRSLVTRLYGPAQIDVLVRVEPDYADAYADVEALTGEFDPDIRFTRETDFSADMARLIDQPTDYICFMCDDVVTTHNINVEGVENLLTDNDIIGVSFRLGTNMLIGMFGNEQPQPDFKRAGAGGRFIKWDMNSAVGDWCYPFDVLGTVYRADFIARMRPALADAKNPSQFENIGSQAWRVVTSQHHYAAWEESRTVVPTPNVVQSEFGNGFIGRQQLDPLFLLLCWNYGMRLDIERYTFRRFASWRIGDFYLKRTV